MKTLHIFSQNVSSTLMAIGMGLLLQMGVGHADSTDEAGAEVQTRGPVHEAFAGVIAYKPQPGLVVTKAPPALIEEVPPDQKPQGENITWIPGYWAWDEERNDFLWVSGVWRALPPGRRWVAGFWEKSGNGYQWTSGYWADTAAHKTSYLSAPPAPLENGPNIASPSEDDIWVPGCWVWIHGHYAWRAGYWIEGRDDWDWSPDYYVWTPRGYVFVDGYWDYSLERRGVLFAPVYFDSEVRYRRGYRYSPVIVIDLAVFPDHLFVRPGYRHYYFGDYYDARYSDAGIYASFSFQSRGYGYDPIFAHQRWEHRRDRDWEHHFEGRYQYRREHDNARPPHTWSLQKSAVHSARAEENTPVAKPFTPLSKNGNNGPRQFQPLPDRPHATNPQRDHGSRPHKSHQRGGSTNQDDHDGGHHKREK